MLSCRHMTMVILQQSHEKQNKMIFVTTS